MPLALYIMSVMITLNMKGTIVIMELTGNSLRGAQGIQGIQAIQGEQVFKAFKVFKRIQDFKVFKVFQGEQETCQGIPGEPGVDGAAGLNGEPGSASASLEVSLPIDTDVTQITLETLVMPRNDNKFTIISRCFNWLEYYFI